MCDGCVSGKDKPPTQVMRWGFVLLKGLGDDLLSHGYTALSSALRRFTVLFGMGRGGSNALWSPRIRELTLDVRWFERFKACNRVEEVKML